jgi:hypothetical protein
MDEAAWTKYMAFKNAALCLRGHSGNPSYNFTSTPRLGSWFNKKCLKGKDITVVQCSSLDNPFISKQEKDLFLDVCSDSEEFEQQEIFASLDKGASINSVVPDKYFNNPKLIVLNQPVNVGIDFAGQGHDEIVITMGNETGIERCEHFSVDKEPEYIFKQFERITQGRTICNIIVDDTGGFASGFIQVCKRTRYESLIRRINFASASLSNYYENIRAEMYFNLRSLMKEDYNVNVCNNLREELAVTTYFLNDRGRKQLIKKELIKRDLGRSPDESDSVVLCTYYPFRVNRVNKSEPPKQKRF